MIFFLGHTIGLWHDFSSVNGGDSSPCNGQGLMSYGHQRPTDWSECSKQNFADQFNKVVQWMGPNEWCLDGNLIHIIYNFQNFLKHSLQHYRINQ